MSVFKMCHTHNHFQNRIRQPTHYCSAPFSLYKKSSMEGTCLNTDKQDMYVIISNTDCIFYTVVFYCASILV